jgi:hypothetical protein
MGRIRTSAATAASILCFALSSHPAGAAQDAKKLAGTWTLVSNVATDAAGKKEEVYGPNPKGQAIFTSNGRYSIFISKPDLPKFAANNRLKGTADENKAVIGGLIAHIGSYSVDEKDKSFTFKVESSSFPNWNGTTQKRPFEVSGDQLKWTTPAASGGGSNDLVWKRVK